MLVSIVLGKNVITIKYIDSDLHIYIYSTHDLDKCKVKVCVIDVHDAWHFDKVFIQQSMA